MSFDGAADDEKEEETLAQIRERVNRNTKSKKKISYGSVSVWLMVTALYSLTHCCIARGEDIP